MTKKIRIRKKKVRIRINEWNPALHPRNPKNGQFVERPYDVPDDIAGMDSQDLVQELAVRNDDFANQVEGLAIDIQDSQDAPGFTDVEVGDALVDEETGAEAEIVDETEHDFLSRRASLELSSGETVSGDEYRENYTTPEAAGPAVPTEIQELVDAVDSDSLEAKANALSEGDLVRFEVERDGQRGQSQVFEVMSSGSGRGETVRYSIGKDGNRVGSLTYEDGEAEFRPQREAQDPSAVTDIMIQ